MLKKTGTTKKAKTSSSDNKREGYDGESNTSRDLYPSDAGLVSTTIRRVGGDEKMSTKQLTVLKSKKKRKLSAAFATALEALDLDFAKLQPRVDRVFEIGHQDGMSDMQIGKEIRKKMKKHYSRMTIWQVFKKYPEARHKQDHGHGQKGKVSLPFWDIEQLHRYKKKQLIAIIFASHDKWGKDFDNVATKALQEDK